MPPPRPEIIGHRGSPRELPENTLPSFRRAIEVGADAVELDVHLTRDRVVVVHHDPIPRAATADPSLGGRPFTTLTLDEVRSFRLPGSFEIPTLADVLDEIDGRATVYVEVKGRGAESAVLDLLDGREAWTAVHAFDHRVVRRIRTHAPAVRGGVLLDSYLVDSPAAMRAALATDLWQRWEFIDAPLVRDVRDAGGRVIAWTVNDVDAAIELVGLGVQGLCTDLPGAMREALPSH